MSTSWLRGHLIEYNWNVKDWVYCDTQESVSIDRSCARCGKLPTPEGYDACKGYVPNMKSVCCGHGKSTPIMMKIDNLEGDEE